MNRDSRQQQNIKIECPNWRAPNRCLVSGATVSPGVCRNCLAKGLKGEHLKRRWAEKAAAPGYTPGPGSLLKKLIAACGIPPEKGCGCAAMAARMDSLGFVGCWREREEIIAWLVAKASEKGITVGSETVHGLLATYLREFLKSKLPFTGSTDS